MTDDELRRACEEWLADPENEFDLCARTKKPYQFQVEGLMRLCQQQRAAVWEDAATLFSDIQKDWLIDHEYSKVDAINYVISLCREQLEKELE